MAYDANPILHGGLTAGAGDADSFATEVWGPAVEAAMKEKLVLAKLCNDLSPLVSGQGEKIHLPKIDQVTAGTKGEGAISWSTSSSDAGEEVLNIDTHKYAAVLINDVIKIQSNYDMMNIFAKELGYSIANAVDEAVNTAMITSASTTSGLVTAQNIDISATPMGAEADFDTIATKALVEDGDPNNWTIVLPPSTYANLMNIGDLAIATQGAALGASFSQTGVATKAYGFNIMMSQNCASGTTDFDTDGTTNSTVHGFVIHKSCLHIAFSQRARLQSQYDVDHLGTKVVADAVFGVLGRNSQTSGQIRSFVLV
tara:strand:- start:897 stop:1835 length:939 start_codon:yes stop_codon:yes gene_type:complete